ncbi:hypothetical protein I5189_03655 [Pseudomonas aeruginosa]|nr:hypothetical protein [Pseudomonas aeruginosa]
MTDNHIDVLINGCGIGGAVAPLPLGRPGARVGGGGRRSPPPRPRRRQARTTGLCLLAIIVTSN